MRLIDADELMEVFRGEEGAKALDHSPLRLIRVKQIVDNATKIPAIPVEWLVNLKNEYAREGREQAEGDLMNLLLMWQNEQEAQDG